MAKLSSNIIVCSLSRISQDLSKEQINKLPVFNFDINLEIELLPTSVVKTCKIIEFRRYTCVIKNENQPSDCTLMFTDDTERTTVNDNGCFTEKNATRDEIMTYCPLQCPEAESAYVTLKRPSNNNKCLAFFTYNVVQRKNDWFLRRSGKCLYEEIQFDIGCTFPFKKNMYSNTVKIKQTTEATELSPTLEQ